MKLRLKTYRQRNVMTDNPNPVFSKQGFKNSGARKCIFNDPLPSILIIGQRLRL